jgi:excisionase family DNA binding protein
MSESVLPPTMTVPELAERVVVDASTAYRYLRAGQLPGVQAGNSWLIDRARVERFVAGLEDAQGRPLVHAPPSPDAPVLTLLPERQPATAELALSWLRGAGAVFEMLCAAAERPAADEPGADHANIVA